MQNVGFLMTRLIWKLSICSNTAGNDIAEESIQHWSDGNAREKITLKEMEKVIQLPALNAKSKFLNFMSCVMRKPALCICKNKGN